MLRIDLTSYDEGLHTLDLEPSAEDLALDPDRFSDIEVAVQLDVRGRRVLVTFTASAQASLECVRTLAPFQQRLEGDYRMLFAPAAQLRSRDAVHDFEEVHALDPSDREIDLTEAVRDTLLLAVPTRPVAPGAEAVELPSAFGAPAPGEEPEGDPRWAALRALRDDAHEQE